MSLASSGAFCSSWHTCDCPLALRPVKRPTVRDYHNAKASPTQNFMNRHEQSVFDEENKSDGVWKYPERGTGQR
jgi:hypothetical protein